MQGHERAHHPLPELLELLIGEIVVCEVVGLDPEQLLDDSVVVVALRRQQRVPRRGVI